MSAVEVKDVWKIYGEQTVLERINMSVEAGAFISLVGPSGCGKSTFLRMILGEEAPSRGQILVDGKPLVAEPSPERGVVFQKYSVFPHMTALQNVMVGLEFAESAFLGRLMGAKRKAAREKATDLLKSVGLGHAMEKYPSELSGGMQQRLALAQAFIKRPKILLLDEPFGALDPGIRSDIHELMLTLWRETGMTVFMVTHDLSEAFKLGTRVIAFDRRRDRPEEALAYGAEITFDITVYRTEESPPQPVSADDMAAAQADRLAVNG